VLPPCVPARHCLALNKLLSEQHGGWVSAGKMNRHFATSSIARPLVEAQPQTSRYDVCPSAFACFSGQRGVSGELLLVVAACGIGCRSPGASGAGRAVRGRMLLSKQ
jgi:glutaminase